MTTINSTSIGTDPKTGSVVTRVETKATYRVPDQILTSQTRTTYAAAANTGAFSKVKEEEKTADWTLGQYDKNGNLVNQPQQRNEIIRTHSWENIGGSKDATIKSWVESQREETSLAYDSMRFLTLKSTVKSAVDKSTGELVPSTMTNVTYQDAGPNWIMVETSQFKWDKQASRWAFVSSDQQPQSGSRPGGVRSGGSTGDIITSDALPPNASGTNLPSATVSGIDEPPGGGSGFDGEFGASGFEIPSASGPAGFTGVGDAPLWDPTGFDPSVSGFSGYSGISGFGGLPGQPGAQIQGGWVPLPHASGGPLAGWVWDPTAHAPTEPPGVLWDVSTTYAKNAIVQWAASPLTAWISLQDGNVGHEPVDGSAYWQVTEPGSTWAWKTDNAASGAWDWVPPSIQWWDPEDGPPLGQTTPGGGGGPGIQIPVVPATTVPGTTNITLVGVVDDDPLATTLSLSDPNLDAATLQLIFDQVAQCSELTQEELIFTALNMPVILRGQRMQLNDVFDPDGNEIVLRAGLVTQTSLVANRSTGLLRSAKAIAWGRD